MKKTYYACDVCEREMSPETGDFQYNTLGQEVCSKCLRTIERLQDRAFEELEKRHGFVVKYRLTIISLLERVDDDKWKELFGTNGLEMRKAMIDDLGGEATGK